MPTFSDYIYFFLYRCMRECIQCSKYAMIVWSKTILIDMKVIDIIIIEIRVGESTRFTACRVWPLVLYNANEYNSNLIFLLLLFYFWGYNLVDYSRKIFLLCFKTQTLICDSFWSLHFIWTIFHIEGIKIEIS